MKPYILLAVYLFEVCSFANVHIDRLFPVPIDYCLTQLDKSGFSTANASTDFVLRCLNQFNINLTGWDHPWIISLYKGMFKAYQCGIHQSEACKEIRIRKEYRQLSDNERRLYHSAILELYKDTVGISLTTNAIFDIFMEYLFRICFACVFRRACLYGV